MAKLTKVEKLRQTVENLTRALAAYKSPEEVAYRKSLQGLQRAKAAAAVTEVEARLRMAQEELKKLA